MNSLTRASGSLLSLVFSKFHTATKDRNQILMYHSVGGVADGDSQGIYTVSPSRFVEQMTTLRNLVEEDGIRVARFGEEVESSVSITFDDGYRDNLTVVLPIMERFGYPFHIFLNPTFVLSGRDGFLSEDDVKVLHSHPLVTLGVHGYSHSPLGQLSLERVRDELSSSKAWLSQLLGKQTDSLSYPHGSVNADVVREAAGAGFRFGAASKFGPIAAQRNNLLLPRIDIWSSDNARIFSAKLRGNWDWMKWRT